MRLSKKINVQRDMCFFEIYEKKEMLFLHPFLNHIQ